MSLMLKAIETYDAMQQLAGVPVVGRQTLTPIGHMLVNAVIEVTIDKDGNFVSAKTVEGKVVIPCTEESSARTSGIAPHPLCDRVDYVSGRNPARHRAYVTQLDKWIAGGCRNPQVAAVSTYVKKQSLLQDLERSWPMRDVKSVKDEHMVVWRVIGLGESSGLVCENLSLQKEYIQYYLAQREGAKADYCMATGKEEKIAANTKHPKGIITTPNGAKIISANDTKNFTYRGRFLDDAEACSVGYIASQKAHNALKWVIANDSVFLGGRICVCWNPSGISIPKIDAPFVILGEGEKPTQSEFKQALAETVLGYKNALPEGEGVVIAMFDATTHNTGRLSVTYYNELRGSDFVGRLASWDDETMFPSSFYGVKPPRLRNFVDFAFGTYREEQKCFVADSKVFRQHMQRMIIARIENGRMPADVIRALAKNASRLSVYDASTRENLLHTVCAAIKKRHKDMYKEEWPMALEKDKKDRSYQYGRLLAILEKMERDTYEASESKRETNAIRSQHMFVQRPQKGFAWIMSKLQQSYIKRLPAKSRVYYDKLIQEIVDILSEFDKEANNPLDETYLMGYYLQKQDLYTKKGESEAIAHESTTNDYDAQQ